MQLLNSHSVSIAHSLTRSLLYQLAFSLADAGEGLATHCPDFTFVCGDTSSKFAGCLAAIDCKMIKEMSVAVRTDKIATFMEQMIPHHVNAVNMAKLLLKDPDNSITELTSLQDGEVDALVRHIINVQNSQISKVTPAYLRRLTQSPSNNAHLLTTLASLAP